MVGGLIMTHSDDKGLRTPPKLAPVEVVIVPIWKTDEDLGKMREVAKRIVADAQAWTGRGEDRIRFHIDDREGIRPGEKYYHWELRGIPLRLEIGPRDLANNQCMVARRDTGEKTPLSLDGLPAALAELLATMQRDMFAAALARREANSIREEISYDRFKEIMEGPGAFVYAGWNGDPAVEAQIKEETKATIRCLPDPEFRSPTAPTRCLLTGEPAKVEALWAKSY
jgi:prolyl-tRNA synthetase